MPRCISRTSPDERSTSRYFARRPSPATVLPSRRATKSFDSGQRRSPRWASTLLKRAPSMTGCSPRRTVSTSGNSGMVTSSPEGDIASPVPPRYGPAAKGLFVMPQSGENTHFGFQQVALGDKQARVDDVFHSVARRYDLMNDLMSGGLHRAWKSTLVSALNPPKARGSSIGSGALHSRPFALLDLAGGTGDVAFRAIDAGDA